MKKPVIVTTDQRGVFFGYCAANASPGGNLKLEDSRCAIYWGTTRGFMELAASGPTPKSKIGAKATIRLSGVTAIVDCTKEAEKKWLAT